MADELLGTIGIVWAGDPNPAVPLVEHFRLHQIFEELERLHVQPVPVIYADEAADDVRKRLLETDGVLVWVDPIVNGRDRSVLDAVLADVASMRIFVSARPDVILKMGTKDVLYTTREMAWGSDTRLYQTPEEFRAQLPEALRTGTRVLKQHRGNGGNGVWKVERTADGRIFLQHGLRGAKREETTMEAVFARCEPYFGGSGCIIDQPYQERVVEGMIRCYLTRDRVVGFGHQYVTALTPPRPGESGPPDPQPRLYYGPDKPEFQRLKQLLEVGWVTEMCNILSLTRDDLPVIWDADFLLGPKDDDGNDSYVLCEINISSVFPIPDEAVAPLCKAATDAMVKSKQSRPRPRA